MTPARTPTRTAILRPDAELLGAFWEALTHPGEVHEVRIPKSRRGPARLYGTVCGYFNDWGAYIEAVSGLTGNDAEAVYITLNPTAPDLRARADNHLKNTAKSTTADDQITRRRNLLIDIDPSRFSDTSATDQERDAALALRDSIYEYLQDMGWPKPVAVTMSGNGGGLIYRIDLPNDDESAALVSGLLEAVGTLFDTEAVTVDRTVFNAARITKVVGTVAAKGDDVPDLGRRWRLSSGTFNRGAVTVSPELIESVIAMAPSSPPRPSDSKTKLKVTQAGRRTWTVPEVLTRNGIGYQEKKRSYGTAYSLDRCLTSDNHADGAVIIERTDGALGYRCHHNGCNGKGWQDVRTALGLKEQSDIPSPAIGTGQRKGQDPLPVIDAGIQDLTIITGLAWDALRAANEPEARLFRHGGLPARIEKDDRSAPVTRELTPDRMRHELARVARWIKIETKETPAGPVEIEHDAKPPADVVRDVLATPNVPLPVLRRIVEAPVFAPDGTLATKPGYHAASKTFYAPAYGFTLPALPDRPTTADLSRATALILDELIPDFPFVATADRAHAVALFLLPFVRDLIDGPTPNHLIEASTPGSGKGLLANALLSPSVGRNIGIIAEAREDEEWRKRITACLREARSVVLLDNILRPIASGVLAAALTAMTWDDRILGKSETVSLPVQCVWVTTANNPNMSTELARRTIRIRLDAKVDRPWLREGFRHADLSAWVDEHRADLIWAALVLTRSWLVAGRPRLSVKPLGSYEKWTAVIGGILDVAGIPGFLSNLDEFYESADSEGALWRQFAAVWWEKFQDTKVGTGELFPLAVEVDGFDLGNGNERAQKTSFGKQLSRQRDRIYGEYRIAQTGTQRRASVWRLLPTRQKVNIVNIGEHCDTPSASHEVINSTKYDQGENVHLSSQCSHTPTPERQYTPSTTISQRNELMAEVSALAAQLGWPMCDYRPGHVIAGNEEAWRKFLMHGTVEHLREAIAKLHELKEVKA